MTGRNVTGARGTANARDKGALAIYAQVKRELAETGRIASTTPDIPRVSKRERAEAIGAAAVLAQPYDSDDLDRIAAKRDRAAAKRERELLQLEDHLEREHGIHTRSGGWSRYTAEPSKSHSYAHRHALGCDELDEHVTVDRMEHR